MCYRSFFMLLLFSAGFVHAETITVATYNIEHFHDNFLAHRMAATQPALPPDDRVKELLDEVRRQNDENNWEIAQVLLDPDFNPDIVVIQEGCRQADLEFFNKRWLDGAYATLITFPTNTTRDQHLNIMLKPGFKVLEQRDQYHLDPDPANNARGDRLFARGPAFVLVESPNGFRFWVGTTHQKSKSGNSLEVTQWRSREAKRTHQIMKELEAGDPHPVMLLGDMNDELGIQEFEAEAGGDVMADLLGSPDDGFLLATLPLVEQGKITFGGYWNPRFRGFIDHIVISRSLQDRVQEVDVIDECLARVASDHYPVLIRLRNDPPSTTQAGN